MLPILPYGGSVLGMIISLKNNARPKRTPFKDKKEKDRTNYKNHYPLSFKRVSKEKLEKIKSRYRDSIVREDNRRLTIISIIIVVLGTFAVYGGIRYYYHVQEQNAKYQQQKLVQDKKNKQIAVVSFEEKYEYLMNSGKKYLSKQHYSYAKHQFHEAVKIKPDDFNANLGLVGAYVYDCIKYNHSCSEAEGYLLQALGKFGRKEQLVKLEEALYSNI